jgi:L-lactate dehydrogenase (cytochrome)
MGIAFCESTVSICSIDEVRKATTAPFRFQLYVMRDRANSEELMTRAAGAGLWSLTAT